MTGQLSLVLFFLAHSACILPYALAKQFNNCVRFGDYYKTTETTKKLKSNSRKMHSSNSDKQENREKRTPLEGRSNINRLEQSKPPPQSTVDDQPTQCFADAAGATVLGTLVLDALWEEIKRAKDCRAAEIELVLDAYFRPDLVVQDSTDAVLSNSLAEYKQQRLGDRGTPGSLVYACAFHQDVSFVPTQEATTEPGIFDDFAWIGNRIVLDSSSSLSTTRQEIYLIELLGAAGSFLYAGNRNKSSKSQGDFPFFYSYHGKKPNKYAKHQCHRPQIYGIVVFD